MCNFANEVSQSAVEEFIRPTLKSSSKDQEIARRLARCQACLNQFNARARALIERYSVTKVFSSEAVSIFSLAVKFEIKCVAQELTQICRRKKVFAEVAVRIIDWRVDEAKTLLRKLDQAAPASAPAAPSQTREHQAKHLWPASAC